MPNHVHAIFVLKNELQGGQGRNAPRRVPTERVLIHPLEKNSLSSVVNHYKGAVKRQCNKQNIDFHWQSRFYDHIIRNNQSLEKIRKYIVNNVIMWEQDENNLILCRPSQIK